jgi:hypothetical protein
VHLEGAKTGVLNHKTKWSKKWGWVGRFGADAHNKLQGCQMRKYITGCIDVCSAFKDLTK